MYERELKSSCNCKSLTTVCRGTYGAAGDRHATALSRRRDFLPVLGTEEDLLQYA